MLIRLAFQYFRGHIATVIAVVLLQVIQAMVNLVLPTLNAMIIDNGVVKTDIGYIVRVGALMVGVTIVQLVFAVLATLLAARLAMGFGYHVRGQLYGHILRLSIGNVRSFGAGSLVTRTTNDVVQMQMVVLMTFTMVLFAPIMGIGSLVLALTIDPLLTLILVVAIPLLLLILVVLLRKIRPLFEVNQTRIDAINRLMGEHLSGVRVIRAFVRQDFQRERFYAASGELRQVMLRIGSIFAVLFPAVDVIIGLAMALTLWFGAGRVDVGGIGIGELTALLTYLMHVLFSIMMATMIFMIFPRAEVSASRAVAVLETQPAIASPERVVALPQGHLSFSLRDVRVQFEGAPEPALDNINLDIRVGLTTAIIGSTGSGKSTLIHLLPRLIDPTSGTVLISGDSSSVNLKQLDLDTLRSRIAWVPQKAYLFAGTIAENVAAARGEDIDSKRVVQALEWAQGMEFVSEYDEGIYHTVHPGGADLSGGQRARVALARALYRRADLYILDDSLSALDYGTDAAVRGALPEATAGAAVVIVASRVATIRHMDSIVVMDEGRIVGTGTHDELVESCETYREIIASQLSESEVR
ncbi:MAG: ABC transporter ATP-binding protein [Varibaculum sp.]|nr:ABC transporter ATP-binding protein [Varibaculum sp.]